MELRVNEISVVPEQDLEKKIAFVAKISALFACDDSGKRLDTLTETSRFVKIEIQNKSGSFCGGQGQILNYEEFLKFRTFSGVKKSEDLLGKPVVSVYTTTLGIMLCGLIPLNMN